MDAALDRHQTHPGRAAWQRWLAVPWQELGVAAALIGAAAAPAFLSAAGDIWADAAADEVVERLVSVGAAADTGIVVSANSVFVEPSTSTADAAMTARIAELDALAPATTTIYTLPGSLTIGPAAELAGTPVRLLARPGAVEALDKIDELPGTVGGVWVPSWLAERRSIDPGDSVEFEAGIVADEAFNDLVPGGGTVASFTVAGIYRSLWSPDDTAPRGYWASLPPFLLPTYLSPLRTPNLELLVLDAATMADSGLSGITRWEAPIVDTPTTLDDLTTLADEYRALERDAVQDRELSGALGDLAGLSPRRPVLVSTLPDTLDEAQTAVDTLDQPLATTRSAGTVIGLAVLVAAAWFVVERRRAEYRLLAGEGDRWWRFAGRAAAQLAAPVAIGTAVGLVAAALVARWAGPAPAVLVGPVDLLRIGAVAAVGLAAASIAVGVIGQRAPGGRTGHRDPTTGAIVGSLIVVAAVVLWFQVDVSPTAGRVVDIGVVVLPLLVLAAAIGVVLAAASSTTDRTRALGRRLPVVGFLAWRRIAAAERGARLVTAALGVGIGTVIFTATLVGTLDRTSDAKVAAEVGSDTRLDLFGPAPLDLDPPERSTIVRVQDTRLTPGGERVRVVAIDPTTLADAVRWPDEFGPDVDAVVELLTAEGGDDVAAVAISGQDVPDSGAFGSRDGFPYRVVGRVRSVPLASDVGATLLVSAARVDEFEIERIAAALDTTVDDPSVLEVYRRPSNRYSRHLLSRQPPTALTGFLADNGLQARATFTAEARAGQADLVAARSSFTYLRLLGIVAVAASVAALALYRAAGSRARALSGVIVKHMGLPPGRIAGVAALEVFALVGIAASTSLVTAPLVARRLAPRFDPAPRLPPHVSTSVPVVGLVGATALGVGLLALGVWLVERRWAARDSGSVVRALD